MYWAMMRIIICRVLHNIIIILRKARRRDDNVEDIVHERCLHNSIISSGIGQRWRCIDLKIFKNKSLKIKRCLHKDNCN